MVSSKPGHDYIFRKGAIAAVLYGVVISFFCSLSVEAFAQDLSEPSVALPPHAERRSIDWLPGSREWTSGVRSLDGGVKNFRDSLADLIASLKGWELIEEEFEYLVRMESDILFDFDSAEIRSEAKQPLTRFAEVLAPYELKVLSISGHTDSKGSDAYNDTLSMKRADSVKDFLVNTKLLSGWSFSAVGRGEREPIASNQSKNGQDDPAGRQKNRRVELRIKKLPK